MPDHGRSSLLQKILVVCLLFVLVAVFLIFDLGDYLTLASLKRSRERLEALYAGNRFSVIAAYMALYILVAALSLPGAAVMTLAGGALFGLVAGTVVVSFSSTIGATLACFVSRFLLRDWVQRKFTDKIERINRGMADEGAFYLFTLRLIPVFPFWMVNLVMGVTRIPLSTFYWVSQIGMLPGTLVYVNAGRELSRIDSLSGILSPGLVASLVLLGLFPLIVKRLLRWYRFRTGRPV